MEPNGDRRVDIFSVVAWGFGTSGRKPSLAKEYRTRKEPFNWGANWVLYPRYVDAFLAIAAQWGMLPIYTTPPTLKPRR